MDDLIYISDPELIKEERLKYWTSEFKMKEKSDINSQPTFLREKDKHKLIKQSERIDPPLTSEIFSAIENTISSKAMSDDNMLQNLHRESNYIRIIYESEEY